MCSAKIEVRGKKQDAQYLGYICSADSKCVLGIDKSIIAPQTYLDKIQAPVFELSSSPRFNKPFDIKPHFQANLFGDHFVIAGQDLELHPQFP